MPNTKLIQGHQAKRRKVLGLLYDLFPVGEEQSNVSVKALAATINDSTLTQSIIDNCVREMDGLGIITRRLEWGSPEKNGMSFGRHYHWTLPLPREVAFLRLDEADASERKSDTMTHPKGIVAPRKSTKKEKPVSDKATVRAEQDARIASGVYDTSKYPAPEGIAVRHENGEAVEAIAGPEAPKPFAGLVTMRKDETGALVEAARQYKTRTKTVHAKIDELAKTARDLGISIDLDMVESAMTVEHDERLETIALVLPYIDLLESTVTRLANDIGQYKAKVKELDDLRVELRKIKQQNERLIAAKAAAVAPPN